MKKYFAMAIAAVMAASALTACGGGASTSSAAPAGSDAASQPASSAASDATSEAPAASGETIKIGLLGPLTGDLSVYGIAATNGAQMAFDEINKAGGISGRQVELILLDEKGDPTEAVNAYNSMVDQGIVALIGDVTSKPCLAVAEVAVEDNMPMLTATGTAADITKVGPNVFRTCFMDPFQGQIMATFAADNLSAKKVAAMFDTSSDYSMGLADSFKAQAESKGMEVTAFEGYAAADTDFTTLLNKIIATSPDAIFVPDYYSDVSLILDQARTAGFKGAMLGGDGWDGVLATLPADKVSAANDGYFSNHYSAADENAAKFLETYKGLYNMDGNAFAALGYDSAYIMAKSIENAGSTESQAIIDAMSEMEYEGVTGHITFDENGDPIKSVAVTKFVDGKAELAAKVSA